MKIVLVEWLDAQITLDDDKPGSIGIICKTVGYLVEKRDDGVVLAMDQSDDKDTRVYWTIPLGMVQRIVELREEDTYGW